MIAMLRSNAHGPRDIVTMRWVRAEKVTPK